MDPAHKKLLDAVRRLYYAAHWSPDRECPADEIWEAVREAAGFLHGTAPPKIHDTRWRVK